MDKIKKIISEMTIEELCGQMINFSLSGNIPFDKFEEFAKKVRPGAVFVSRTDGEKNIRILQISIQKCRL